MKILEVITLGEIGGAQTVLVDLIKGFSNNGYNVEIDVAFGEGEYLTNALSDWFRGNVIKIPYLKRKINLFSDFRAFFQLRDLCKKRKYDLVHCHSSKASWLGRLAALSAGVPRTCVTVHGISFRPGISKLARVIYRNIERLVVSLNLEYVFVSSYDLAEMESIGLKRAQCRVIPNGRPVPPKPNMSLRELLSINNKVPIVCMIGRISEQKNPLSFIRVAKNVIELYPKDLPAPVFVLIGDGPLKEKCKAAIQEANISEFVYLLGSVDNAAKYFWDAEIALLTSNYEACPLVVIEAMAAGTPVVASDVGGTGEIVKHGKTGYLFKLNNESEAAQYINDLLTDTQLHKTIGKTAFEFYQREFTVERMINEYVVHFGLHKIPKA